MLQLDKQSMCETFGKEVTQLDFAINLDQYHALGWINPSFLKNQ